MNDMKQACCPFCGSDDISAGEVMTASDQGFHYTQSECQGCGALGPRAELPPGDIDYGDVKAITAWNRRTQTEATKPAQDLGERNTQGPLLIARIKRYKEAFDCSTAEAKEACEYGRDMNSDQTAFVSPPKKDSSLARQVIQDTNDTLREQSEALVQLKAENDQLRAALASPADALVAGDGTQQEANADAKDAGLWRYLVQDGKSMSGKFTIVQCDAEGAIHELHGSEYEAAIDAARQSTPTTDAPQAKGSEVGK